MFRRHRQRGYRQTLGTYGQVMERRSWATPILVVLVVIWSAACSGSNSKSSGSATPAGPTAAPAESAVPDQGIELEFPAASPELLLGAPVVRQFEGLPLTDVAVSPDADRVAVARDGEVCVISTSPDVPTSADRCYPFPSGIAPGSVTWSPDGTTLVFHHDIFRFGQEPDLVELDLASGELTVLTDDGVPIDRRCRRRHRRRTDVHPGRNAVLLSPRRPERRYRGGAVPVCRKRCGHSDRPGPRRDTRSGGSQRFG